MIRSQLHTVVQHLPESPAVRKRLSSVLGLGNMAGSSDELRAELNRLLTEQIASLKRETFGGVDEKELRTHVERLKRIREVTAEYVAVMRQQPGE